MEPAEKLQRLFYRASLDSLSKDSLVDLLWADDVFDHLPLPLQKNIADEKWLAHNTARHITGQIPSELLKQLCKKRPYKKNDPSAVLTPLIGSLYDTPTRWL